MSRSPGTHLVSQQLPYLTGLKAEAEKLCLQGKAALLPVDAGHLHLDFGHDEIQVFLGERERQESEGWEGRRRKRR